MKKYYQAILNDDYEKIVKKFHNSFLKEKKEFIITANAEIFMEALNNSEIDEMLTNKDNTVIADGISIVKTAKYFNLDLNSKIAGIEICQDLLNYATDKKYKVYIYGSKQEVLDLLKEKYPTTNFVGLKNGYDNEVEDIKKDILKKKPDLIIVALGVPKQELVINEIIDEASKGIFIGVGGSIDVISGYKKRAPKFFRKYNLEWLYRILKEPKRLKRFWNHNVKLFIVAKKYSKKEA